MVVPFAWAPGDFAGIEVGAHEMASGLVAIRPHRAPPFGRFARAKIIFNPTYAKGDQSYTIQLPFGDGRLD